jgi:hypothetical protein
VGADGMLQNPTGLLKNTGGRPKIKRAPTSPCLTGSDSLSLSLWVFQRNQIGQGPSLPPCPALQVGQPGDTKIDGYGGEGCEPSPARNLSSNSPMLLTKSTFLAWRNEAAIANGELPGREWNANGRRIPFMDCLPQRFCLVDRTVETSWGRGGLQGAFAPQKGTRWDRRYPQSRHVNDLRRICCA